jgi:hypothetical protein
MPERRALLDACGEDAFLDPEKLAYPVVAKRRAPRRRQSCAVDCDGAAAAIVNARRWKRPEIEQLAREAYDDGGCRKGRARSPPAPAPAPRIPAAPPGFVYGRVRDVDGTWIFTTSVERGPLAPGHLVAVDVPNFRGIGVLWKADAARGALFVSTVLEQRVGRGGAVVFHPPRRPQTLVINGFRGAADGLPPGVTVVKRGDVTGEMVAARAPVVLQLFQAKMIPDALPPAQPATKRGRGASPAAPTPPRGRRGAAPTPPPGGRGARVCAGVLRDGRTKCSYRAADGGAFCRIHGRR